MKPEWQHKVLTLPVGSGKYLFRTLSLYDVWCLWPTFKVIHDEIKAHHPIAFSTAIVEAIEYLCPGFTKTDDYKKFSSVHVDALIEFYGAQDWGRIRRLGERLPDKSAPAPEQPVDVNEAQQNFFLICLGGARAANIGVPEFMQQRFEFCADSIMAMREELKVAREARGVLDGEQFVGLMSSMLPTIKTPEDQKPAFIREIEDKSRVQ